MRMKPKPRQVISLITGEPIWSAYPLTREEAYEEDIVKYWPMAPCPLHGDLPVAYTLTGILACCARHNAAADFNDARISGAPTSISEAKVQGLDYFYTYQPHPRCGHTGKVTLDGRCWICREEKNNTPLSPRQIAVRAGDTWYMPAPDTPCPRGHVAMRRVDNGRCKACEDEDQQAKKASKVIPETAINKICPDMIISRNDARTMGFKVYRTGEPCHRGHRGWRYVSTLVCIDCKNGK